MKKFVTIPIKGEKSPITIFIGAMDYLEETEHNTCIIHLSSGKSFEYIKTIDDLRNIISNLGKH